MNNPSLRCVVSRYHYSGIIFILLLTLAPAWAQTQSGRLQIRVLTLNQEAVSDATVTLVNKSTNQSRTATTSDDGLAVFEGLAPGTYDVAVTKEGFPTAAVADVQIAVGKQTSIVAELGVKSRDVKVRVAGVAADEEKREEEISALPNLNNDLTPLLQTVPGSIATGPAALGRIIIDGKGNDQQTVRLDGVDFQVLSDLPTADSGIDGLGSFQKPEVAGDIDNASPQTRAFAARFGPGTGSVLDTQTYKGDGTAGWKAQLFTDYRNDVFNARNFFDYDGKNGLRRSRLGAKIGGPLSSSNRSLLFLAYDGIFGRTERNVYEAIPADAACACTSGPLAEVMRGFLPAGTQLMIGASRNPDFEVAHRRTRTTAKSNAVNIRYDFLPYLGEKKDSKDTARSKNVLTLRLTQQAARNQVPDGITGRLQQQRVDFTNALASYVAAFNETSTHTFKFGFNRTRARVETRIPPQPGIFLGDAVINTGGTAPTVGLPGDPPTVPVASLGGLMKGIGRGFDLDPRSFGLSYDYLGFVRERDEFRFGVETRFIRMNLDRLGGLTYSFPNVAALRSGIPGSVTYQSDLSVPGPFNNGSGPRQARQHYFLGYIQMLSQIGKALPNPTNQKTESRLLLTYGLRYDYFSDVRERDNRAVVVDPATGQILPQGSSFYRKPRLNLQPRFGIAYRLSDKGFMENTVVRAGVGIYAGTPRIGDLTLPIESDRFSTGISGGTFPANPAVVVNPFITNPDARKFQPLTFARDFTPVERFYKWEAQLTQTIHGYNIGVLYTGNVSRNLPLATIANKIVSVTTNPDPTKPACVVREFDIVRGGCDQIFQPFAEFFLRTGNGRNAYDGVTLSFGRNINAKPSTHLRPWLQGAVRSLSVQYTYSRNRGNASGSIATNPFDFDSDFGFNAADVPHSFKVSAVYDLWTAKGSGVANRLWGWKIMPSFRASSGFPLLVRLNRPDVVYRDASGNIFATPAVGRTAIINTPGGGESANARVPHLIPGVNPLLRNDREFLNPAAFAIPAPGTFGYIERGSLRAPKIISFDLGLRHNLFNVAERRFSGQFQVDIFNVFNHPNFINPTAALPGVLGTSAADNQLQPGVPFTRASAGTFGIFSAADTGRLIQFSLTLRFNDGFTK